MHASAWQDADLVSVDAGRLMGDMAVSWCCEWRMMWWRRRGGGGGVDRRISHVWGRMDASCGRGARRSERAGGCVGCGSWGM